MNTAPVNHAVAELLLHVARRMESPGIDWVMLEDEHLEFSVHAEKLLLIERLGVALDWPYVRLSPSGRTVVEEAIAAMRAVH